VKTRTLILLAMACGLAILLAGGAFLWRVIANKDELTVPDASGVGQSQQVGPVSATVMDASDIDGAVVVQVRLESTEPLADAGTGWAFVVGGDIRQPVAVPAGGGVACAGTAVPPGRSVDCALAFQPGDGDRFVSYAVDGAKGLWKVERPLP
jgi:hypothetical protein